MPVPSKRASPTTGEQAGRQKGYIDRAKFSMSMLLQYIFPPYVQSIIGATDRRKEAS